MFAFILLREHVDEIIGVRKLKRVAQNGYVHTDRFENKH